MDMKIKEIHAREILDSRGTPTVEAEVTLSHLERMFMRDVAEENRAKGISMANDICKNYRREGMFFDEILDEAKAGGN